MIKTNPTLIASEQIEGIASIIVRTLINDECHHELLQFEGLLALTNISAAGDYKSKLVTLGVWGQVFNIVSSFQIDKATPG